MKSPFEPIPTEIVPKLALSREELSEAIGVCLRTIDSLIACGELPSVQIGKRRLFPVREIREWLSDQATNPATDF